MNNISDKLHKKYDMEIRELLTEYEYRYYRYKLEYSLVFFYLPNKDDISNYAKLIRLTDTFIKLEENFYCIVYEGANREQAAKAANNLLGRYKKEYSDSMVYIGIMSPGKKKIYREDVVTRLFKLLEEIILEKQYNIVIAQKD